MRALFLGLFFLSFVLILTGCQGFLEDYSYKPVGVLSSQSE